MKKISLGILVAAFLLVPGFSVVSAQTATTTVGSNVEQLLAQIRLLQTQIEVLKAAQQKVNEAAQNIQGTFAMMKGLRQGMAGDDVMALQALLATDQTIYPEGTISGYYGAFTAKAVKRFQKKHGLEQAGLVGPKTLKKLNELLREHPIAFEHSTSTKLDDDIDDDDGDDEHEGGGNDKERRPCAVVPFGHMIASGWLKKHKDDDRQIVLPCKTLPGGIEKKIDDDWKNGTTTHTASDTTAPLIADVSTGSVTATSATVMWTTNEVSNSKVLYAVTNPVLIDGSHAVVANATFVTNHSVGLSLLTASTTYYYIVVSSDANGNKAVSSQSSFTTLAL